jgi:uncharacterized protein YjbI with pentapeptide repeats
MSAPIIAYRCGVLVYNAHEHDGKHGVLRVGPGHLFRCNTTTNSGVKTDVSREFCQENPVNEDTIGTQVLEEETEYEVVLEDSIIVWDNARKCDDFKTVTIKGKYLRWDYEDRQCGPVKELPNEKTETLRGLKFCMSSSADVDFSGRTFSNCWFEKLELDADAANAAAATAEFCSRIHMRNSMLNLEADTAVSADAAAKAAAELSSRCMNFDGATFDGVVQFKDAKFYGGASFEKAKFNVMNFSNVAFEQQSNFKQATFKEMAIFSHTVFHGEANFMEATFGELKKGRHNFNDARFFGGAQFEKAKFDHVADFQYAVFASEVGVRVRFKGTKFAPCSLFRSMCVAGRILAPGIQFTEATLVGADFTHAEFPVTTVDFSKASLEGAVLKHVKFGGIVNFNAAKISDTTNLVELTMPHVQDFKHIAYFSRSESGGLMIPALNQKANRGDSISRLFSDVCNFLACCGRSQTDQDERAYCEDRNVVGYPYIAGSGEGRKRHRAFYDYAAAYCWSLCEEDDIPCDGSSDWLELYRALEIFRNWMFFPVEEKAKIKERNTQIDELRIAIIMKILCDIKKKTMDYTYNETQDVWQSRKALDKAAAKEAAAKKIETTEKQTGTIEKQLVALRQQMVPTALHEKVDGGAQGQTAVVVKAADSNIGAKGESLLKAKEGELLKAKEEERAAAEWTEEKWLQDWDAGEKNKSEMPAQQSFRQWLDNVEGKITRRFAVADSATGPGDKLRKHLQLSHGSMAEASEIANPVAKMHVHRNGSPTKCAVNVANATPEQIELVRRVDDAPSDLDTVTKVWDKATKVLDETISSYMDTLLESLDAGRGSMKTCANCWGCCRGLKWCCRTVCSCKRVLKQKEATGRKYSSSEDHIIEVDSDDEAEKPPCLADVLEKESAPKAKWLRKKLLNELEAGHCETYQLHYEQNVFMKFKWIAINMPVPTMLNYVAEIEQVMKHLEGLYAFMLNNQNLNQATSQWEVLYNLTSELKCRAAYRILVRHLWTKPEVRQAIKQGKLVSHCLPPFPDAALRHFKVHASQHLEAQYAPMIWALNKEKHVIRALLRSKQRVMAVYISGVLSLFIGCFQLLSLWLAPQISTIVQAEA